MNTILRLLALLGLAPFIFALVRFSTTPPATVANRYPENVLSAAAITIVALLGFAAVIAAGIGATMVSLEQRQRGWAAVLLGALALNAIWQAPLTLLAPFAATAAQDPLRYWNALSLLTYSVEVLLAVVVLAYTVARHPDVPGAPRLLAVNGTVRALTIAGITALVIYAVFSGTFWPVAGGPPNGLQLPPQAQGIFVAVGAVLAVAGTFVLVVDCLQRRRHGRAVALIVVLLLPAIWRFVFLLAAFYIQPLFSFIRGLIFDVPPVQYMYAIFLFVPFLPVAVLALILSFFPRTAPPAAVPAPVAESTGDR